MKPCALNGMKIMRHPFDPQRLLLCDPYNTGNGFNFDRDDVIILAKLLRHIARQEMPKWDKPKRAAPRRRGMRTVTRRREEF